jgi:hypothetical protein
MCFESMGSTRTSPTSTMTLFESITEIELSFGSSGSLKNSSTCTGGVLNTALACGLERNNSACAKTGTTAHALKSRTITIDQNIRRLIFNRSLSGSLPHRSFTKGCYANSNPDQPDKHTEPNQPIRGCRDLRRSVNHRELDRIR